MRCTVLYSIRVRLGLQCFCIIGWFCSIHGIKDHCTFRIGIQADLGTNFYSCPILRTGGRYGKHRLHDCLVFYHIGEAGNGTVLHNPGNQSIIRCEFTCNCSDRYIISIRCKIFFNNQWILRIIFCPTSKFYLTAFQIYYRCTSIGRIENPVIGLFTQQVNPVSHLNFRTVFYTGSRSLYLISQSHAIAEPVCCTDHISILHCLCINSQKIVGINTFIYFNLLIFII